MAAVKTRVLGPEGELQHTLTADITSGDIIVVDARAYIYTGKMNKVTGDVVTLHDCPGKLEVTCPTGYTAAVEDTVLMDLATQELVSTGGTKIGRYTKAKATGDTKAEIILNDRHVAPTV